MVDGQAAFIYNNQRLAHLFNKTQDDGNHQLPGVLTEDELGALHLAIKYFEISVNVKLLLMLSSQIILNACIKL